MQWGNTRIRNVHGPKMCLGIGINPGFKGLWLDPPVLHQASGTPDRRGRNYGGIARNPIFLLLPVRCNLHAANRNEIARTGFAPVDVKAKAA